MSPREMFEKFVSFMYLDYEQLILADRWIENHMKDYSDKFEYYYDLHLYAMKCFNVLKKQKNCRIGLTVCKGEVIDLLYETKHQSCSCSKVLFRTNLSSI